MNKKFNDWQFYHIYPLGFCNAPEYNDFISKPCFRLDLIRKWTPHLKNLGINALYLGPVFESTHHGYDTKDFCQVDRRLGTIDNLKELIDYLHQNNIIIILDGVFNHVGRDFWAFKDVQINGEKSFYKDWFENLNFNQKSPYNDLFSYDSWNGCYDLIKLNLRNNFVKEHIFEAVKMWIEYLKIDGIRLDACDTLDFDFIYKLSSFTRQLKSDIWLMGEIIHGDYRKWANDLMLDSVTNYECYKGLWSSFNDVNLFEIAYSLNREFGEHGLYCNIGLYNFVDNHDVNRVASVLHKKTHLYPLYILLYTMPGIPSIYYGSEWGIYGEKKHGSDKLLRPFIELDQIEQNTTNMSIKHTIIKLSKIRTELKSLRYGNYKGLYIDHQQFIFIRSFENEQVIIMINSDDKEKEINLNITISGYDVLNNEKINNDQNKTLKICSNWGRIIKL